MNQLNPQKTTFKCPACLKLFIFEHRIVRKHFFVNSETLGIQIWRKKYVKNSQMYIENLIFLFVYHINIYEHYLYKLAFN